MNNKTVPFSENLNIPDHIAIIMDGNGRWARRRGMTRTSGHRKGVEAVQRTVEAAGELGVKVLTLFGFSTENWSRPENEVNDLMGLLKHYLKSKTAELHKNNVKVTMIGDRSRMPKDIISLIENAEKLTKKNDGLRVQVALSYSGRFDILQSVQTIARKVSEGELAPDEITEFTINSHLQTHDVIEPDLLIRTSGEQRISNFLLWQCAYTELFFSDTLWPDFGKNDLLKAIASYSQRERRFGNVHASAN